MLLRACPIKELVKWGLVIASLAKQSISAHGAKWIASSQGLLAVTEKQLYFMGYISVRLSG